MIIGVFIGLGVSLVLFLCGYIGFKLANKTVKETKTVDELEAIRKRDEGINNVLNYDYDTALGKRR